MSSCRATNAGATSPPTASLAPGRPATSPGTADAAEGKPGALAEAHRQLEAERQRANRLGDEAGSLRCRANAFEVRGDQLLDQIADLESTIRGKDRRIEELRHPYPQIRARAWVEGGQRGCNV